MKSYIHARLSSEDRSILEGLKKATGYSESELIRQGLRLILEKTGKEKNALDLAGASVGKFAKGPKDLARNKKHLEDFGE